MHVARFGVHRWEMLGYPGMRQPGADWWMDGSTQWHRGEPPAGWQQAADGRWRCLADEPTVEMGPAEAEPTIADLPAQSPGAAHLAAGGRSTGGPARGRLALLVAAVLVAVGALVAVAVLGGADGEVAIDPPPSIVTTGRPTTTAAPAPPAAPSPAARTGSRQHAGRGSGTTSDAPAPVATTASPEPAPAPPVLDALQPGTACSPDGVTTTSGDRTAAMCTRQRCEGAPYASPRWRRWGC